MSLRISTTRHFRAMLGFAVAISSAAHSEAADGFRFREQDEILEIFRGEQRIAVFLKEHPELSRQALVNVTTHRGVPVTRSFPPRLPEDRSPGFDGPGGIDHAVMHPGIWISFGDVDGHDYWRLQASSVHESLNHDVAPDGRSAKFVSRHRYLSADASSLVCTETLDVSLYHRPQGIYMVVTATYQSDTADFYFGDQEESGLAVRVASNLRVLDGQGTLLNDQGERNGGAVWGKEAAWVDYFAVSDGREVGVMVVPAPSNARRCWMHARDYGLIVANPFPRQPRERREPYVKTWVSRGEPFQLRYALLIHDLEGEAPLNRETAYQTALDLLNRPDAPESHEEDGRRNSR